MARFNPIFHVPTVAQSKSIDLNNGTITSATMTIVSSVGNFVLYMSANGGTNWEEVTSGVAHTFTNTGTDLRWRIEGSGTITRITITSYH